MDEENEVDFVKLEVDKSEDSMLSELRELLLKSSQQNFEAMSNSFGSDIIEPTLPLFDLSHLVINNTWHGRCVNLKATVAANHGWTVNAEKEDTEVPGQIKETIDNAAKGAEEQRRNHQGLGELLRCIAVDLESLGNAYIEVVRDGAGKPREFYHVPSLTVRKRRGGGYWQIASLSRNVGETGFTSETLPRQTTQTFQLLASGTYQKIFFKEYGDTDSYSIEGEKGNFDEENTANEMIHIRRYHALSPFYGIPDWITSFTDMIMDECAEKWNLAFFENSCVPRWLILIMGARMQDKTKDDFRIHFQETLKGRPHLPMVLDVPGQHVKIEAHKLEADVNEASFLEMKDKCRDAIIAAHGVPPRMMGIHIPGRLGGKGDAQKQREDFKSFTIQPLQQLLVTWINELILPEYGWQNYKVELNSFDTQDAEEFKSMGESVAKLASQGILSPNEARQKLGLDPIKEKWADEYYLVQGDRFLHLTDEKIEEEAEDSKEDMDIKDNMRTARNQLKDILQSDSRRNRDNADNEGNGRRGAAGSTRGISRIS